VSPGFFKKKAKAPSDSEFRGPLDLVPGDRVLYYQQEFTLAGVIFLVRGKERRCQYHFLDASEMHVVLAFEPGPDPQITLEHALAQEDHPDVSGDAIDLDGTTFVLKTTLDVTAFCIGGIPGEKGSAAACRAYEDEDEMEVLNVEDWGGYVEIRKGEVIHENELVVRRQRDEDDWEIKPPPRIDLRSLNEARRSRQLAETRATEQQKVDELAAAREKLAAFSEEPEPVEDADAVALSDIVDPAFRFVDDRADCAYAEDEEITGQEVAMEDPYPSTELPSLEADPAPADPFQNIFEGEEQEDVVEFTPDPYQAYMEDEREDDFPDSAQDADEEEPAALEPNPRFGSSDGPRSYLTEDTTENFLNAGVYEDDEDEI